MKTVLNKTTVNLEGIHYIDYAQQYYGDNCYLVVHYYNGEDTWVPVKDYEEYHAILLKIKGMIENDTRRIK